MYNYINKDMATLIAGYLPDRRQIKQFMGNSLSATRYTTNKICLESGYRYAKE